MKRRRAVMGVGAALVIFLLADAFVAPRAHDVHTPGGAEVNVTFFDPTEKLSWMPTDPSESLADMHCLRPQARPPTCDPTDLTDQFPNLTQSPHTLYFVWARCLGLGTNAEYFPATRSLVIHCYTARQWLWLPGPPGVGPTLFLSLTTVRIGSVTPGRLTIKADQRVEHLFGDQSDEFQVATAAIP